jgi:hypothetical protein
MQGVKMYKNGMSAGEIASTFGVSPRANPPNLSCPFVSLRGMGLVF